MHADAVIRSRTRSFGIGGDGQIYEGRGFGVVGAHAPRFNDKSIGICMIGDWRSECSTMRDRSFDRPDIFIGIAESLIVFKKICFFFVLFRRIAATADARGRRKADIVRRD